MGELTHLLHGRIPVRRTHNPSGTKLSTPSDPERARRVREITEAGAAEPGPLLEILHGVQHELGHIDPEDIPVIADVLNLSRADVHGVVTFYPDFRMTPPVAHMIQLCRGEACQARGSEELYAATLAGYADRSDVEVSPVFCFGNCALGPSGMLDGRLYGRLGEEQLADLTKEWTR